ncbi:MAG: hypothetical protein JXR63_03860 [Spirochaetales bacterium]|nr:hypothetical protein [Spirochaetales bacterium]
MRKICIIYIFFLFVVGCSGSKDVELYIAENHGDSYFFVKNYSIESGYKGMVLVNFDHHSDYSPATAWSKRGEEFENFVQCHNWIEPLLPEIVSQVIWVCTGEVSECHRAERLQYAKKKLFEMGRYEDLEAKADLIRVVFFEELSDCLASLGGKKIAVSVDLDYFFDRPTGLLDEEIQAVVDYVFSLKKLVLVTSSLSLSFQESDEKAYTILNIFVASCEKNVSAVNLLKDGIKGRTRDEIRYYYRSGRAPQIDLQQCRFDYLEM